MHNLINTASLGLLCLCAGVTYCQVSASNNQLQKLTNFDECTYTWLVSEGHLTQENGARNAAGTVEECQQLCIDDVTCTAIDYDTAGNCFLHYSDVGGTDGIIGFDHYDIVRDCPTYISGPCMPACTQSVLIQRSDGLGTFNRNWTEFKNGFSDASGRNFWIGNDNLHILTKYARYTAQFQVQSASNSLWYVANYDYFIVDPESNQYMLHVFGFLGGNATEGSFSYYHDGKKFTTFDEDNDMAAINCAENNGGGWWYYNNNLCTVTNINGHVDNYGGFVWDGVPGAKLMDSRLYLICR